MKVAFIVKPPLKEEYQREFLAFEREFKGEIKEEFTEKEGPNNAKNLAKKAVEESFERVVVVGGDGLLNETINGIAEATGGKIPQDFTLGIIPTGSGNNFAKALGIPKDIKKAFEIIYVKDGKILEGSASNVFMVKSGKIFTSRQGIFSGCARGLVIHLAKKRKIGVKEKEIFQEEFLTADEIFLTGSGKGIVPVTQVENLKIKNGQVGEITKILMDDYDQFVKNYKSE